MKLEVKSFAIAGATIVALFGVLMSLMHSLMQTMKGMGGFMAQSGMFEWHSQSSVMMHFMMIVLMSLFAGLFFGLFAFIYNKLSN